MDVGGRWKGHFVVFRTFPQTQLEFLRDDFLFQPCLGKHYGVALI